MHAAIFFGSFAADFAQVASAFFLGSDSSNTRKNTVSFNSKTSCGDRLLGGGAAALGGSWGVVFFPSLVAAGGGAVGAALAAWALVEELEAAAGSGSAVG